MGADDHVHCAFNHATCAQWVSAITIPTIQETLRELVLLRDDRAEYTWVKYHDELLVVLVEAIYKWAQLFFRVVDRMKGEVFESIHMVNVTPHWFHGEFSCLILFKDVLKFLHILVPVSWLVETCNENSYLYALQGGGLWQISMCSNKSQDSWNLNCMIYQCSLNYISAVWINGCSRAMLKLRPGCVWHLVFHLVPICLLPPSVVYSDNLYPLWLVVSSFIQIFAS